MTIPDQPLRTRMIGATRWVVFGSAAMHVLRLGSNLVVTRLLVPEMFGLMAIATTVGVIMVMLSDIGLHQAVVRSSRGDEQAFLDTIWVLKVARGFLLWGGSIAAALALYFGARIGWIPSASTYGNETLPALIIATGFSSVIIGFASTLSMSATRRFDTKLIFQLDLDIRMYFWSDIPSNINDSEVYQNFLVFRYNLTLVYVHLIPLAMCRNVIYPKYFDVLRFR